MYAAPRQQHIGEIMRSVVVAIPTFGILMLTDKGGVCVKRFVLVFVMLMAFIATYAYADRGDEIHNEVKMGMTPAEVVALETQHGDFYNTREYLEGTLLEQPYTLLLFNYADSDTEAAHFDKYGKQMVQTINGEYMDFELSVNYVMAVIDMSFRLTFAEQSNPLDPYGVNTSYEVTNEDLNRNLIQVHGIFTADQYYKTAVLTFEDVEDCLEALYGTTRYTTRRGERLPLYKGWLTDTTAMTVMPITELEASGYYVTEYSHRVAKIADGKYMVIDHHILIKGGEDETTFQHEIVYTLVPWDISGGYAVDCTK